MKIHRKVSDTAQSILAAIVEAAGDPDAPIFVAPGMFHGEPVTVVYLKADQEGLGEGRVALAPLAVVLSPEAAAHVTMDGLTKVGQAPEVNAAPSPASGPQEAEAIKVLRDVLPILPHGSALGERAARVLREVPAAPAAVERVGVYL